jgi:hypothetical protein
MFGVPALLMMFCFQRAPENKKGAGVSKHQWHKSTTEGGEKIPERS